MNNDINISMIGIDHSAAGIDVREKFSFTKKGLLEALPYFHSLDGVRGCVILSTCNRLEIYISTYSRASVDLFDALCRLKQVDPEKYRTYFAFRSAADAVSHLFSLTAGLESRIIGEDQILMQVKTAISIARDEHVSDVVTEVLFRMAVTSGKKVKTEVSFSHSNSSAVSAALSALENSGTSFADMKCLVIGNGEMGRLTATALIEKGADVTVTVRQYHSGEVQIPKGSKCIPYSERYELLPECPMVISATSSPNLTLTAEALVSHPLTMPTLFLDLAVPRDIDPAIANIPYASLYDIDSFSVSHQSQEVQGQITQAQRILKQDIAEFISWYACRDFIPLIQSISDGAADDITWRSGPAMRKASQTDTQCRFLEDAVHTSASKVIQKMLFTLRDNIEPDALRSCLTALSKVYGENDLAEKENS